jgi:kinesin family protein 3/17
LEESEKNRLLQEAELRMQELEKEKEARHELLNKLAQLQQKLLVGGVNILDQHQQQQIMLAKKAQEMEENIKRQRELEQEVNQKEELNLQIEEQYSNLQEEAISKTKKLKKFWQKYMEQKAELKDVQLEHQSKREDLLETIHELTIEIKLRQTILSGFIPPEEQEIINDCAEYDEPNEKWRIAHIAHAGNNIRDKRSLITGQLQNTHDHLNRKVSKDEEDMEWDPMCIFPDPYLSYEVPGLKKSKKTNSASKKKKKAAAPQARGLVAKSKHYA